MWRRREPESQYKNTVLTVDYTKHSKLLLEYGTPREGLSIVTPNIALPPFLVSKKSKVLTSTWLSQVGAKSRGERERGGHGGFGGCQRTLHESSSR